MSVNSSSSSNASLPLLPLLPPSSCPTLFCVLCRCMVSRTGFFSMITFTIVSILLVLPLCILVIHLGLQRWRQRRSLTSMSHSDVFTYNIVIIELMNVVGCIILCCGIFTKLRDLMTLSIYLFNVNLNGQMYFHVLICIERYLAVVYPVTYMTLRKTRGIRIRNIAIGGVWLLCFVGIGFITVADQYVTAIVYIFLLGFSLSVVSFCSLSVLCVLIRPGPGEGGGGTQQVGQSKRRAFNTIMAILGVLLVKLGGTAISSALYASQLSDAAACASWLSVVGLSLPSSFVLPLLFLQRAGKLLCCK